MRLQCRFHTECVRPLSEFEFFQLCTYKVWAWVLVRISFLPPTSHYTPTMSSSNIGGNNGNDASGIDWKWVVSPDLLKQMDDSIKVQIAKVNEQLQ